MAAKGYFIYHKSMLPAMVKSRLNRLRFWHATIHDV